MKDSWTRRHWTTGDQGLLEWIAQQNTSDTPKDPLQILIEREEPEVEDNDSGFSFDSVEEILDEKNSILFNPDEPNDFKKKLVDALENFDQYKSTRLAARAAIDEQGLTWQKNAERVINLIKAKV